MGLFKAIQKTEQQVIWCDKISDSSTYGKTARSEADNRLSYFLTGNQSRGTLGDWLATMAGQKEKNLAPLKHWCVL